MDDNRILTNKIFKQKINELVGADVVELEAANDDLALNCKVFETGMDAIKTIIPEPGPTPEPGSKILVCNIMKRGGSDQYTCDKLISEIVNAYLFGDYDYIVAKSRVDTDTYMLPLIKAASPDEIIFSGSFENSDGVTEMHTFKYSGNEINYDYSLDYIPGTEIAHLTLYDAEHGYYRSDKTLAELYNKWQKGWSVYLEAEIADEPLRFPVIAMGSGYCNAFIVGLNDGTPTQIMASWENTSSNERWAIDIT